MTDTTALNELDRLPWEQQDGESPQAYEAFRGYLDQYPTERSQPKLAKTLGKSRSLLSKWAVQWHWIDRVTTYDVWNERQQFEEHRRNVAKMHKDHSDGFAAVYRNLLLPAEALLAKMRADRSGTIAQLTALPTKDLVRLTIEVGRVLPNVASAERLARALPMNEPVKAVDPGMPGGFESVEELEDAVAAFRESGLV
jgi:hypothetical protein